MRQAVGNFQQNLGQLAQGFEPAARKSWLMHALQDESDVRTQINLIVADELKVSEKSVVTRVFERLGAMQAESKEFTENYARLVGTEVQRNLVSRTDSIMSKLEQVTSKAAET